MYPYAVVLQLIGILSTSLHKLPTVSSQCEPGDKTRPLELAGEGTVSSPNYPADYYNNADCQWRIKSTSQTVAMTIISFSTESCCDAVDLYDGSSTDARQFARLVGSIPANTVYQSTQHWLFIRFTSDSSVTAHGFSASFSSPKLTPLCDGSALVLSESGVLSSPDFPSNYPLDVDCRWRLTAPVWSANQIVSLTFTYFGTEECCDYVAIYDGLDMSASLLANVSGSPSTPIEYSSTGKNLYVRFLSDEAVVNEGFNAVFSQTAAGCSASTRSRELTALTGTINSPNFNRVSFYHNNAECQWKITAPQTGLVTIVFSVFQTESCCDLVSIYDGLDSESPLIDIVSGNLGQLSRSSTQQHMFVTFTSDASNGALGFTATYTLTAAGCTADTYPHVLMGSGVVSSPNHPNNYPDLADCQWQLIATEDAVVTLTIMSFVTEALDVVNIYDGNMASPDTLIATLSGAVPVPRVYTSTQRYMTIRFTTSPFTNFAGFYATFSSTGVACVPGSRPLLLTGGRGELMSSSYPSNYQNNADCQWLIYVSTPNSIVNLALIDFNTESCCDFLTVHDGDSVESRLIVKLSGSGYPPRAGYNSTQSYMFVQFTSDASVTARGFQALYSEIK